jgi:phosphoglycolate phosphatase
MKKLFRFQSVIFDLDGTLIDSSPSILKCFGQVLNEHGLTPLVPLNDALIGPPLRQTLVNLTGATDSAFLDRLVDGFKACYDTEGYKEARVYDGVEAMLVQLAESGITLAIATNKRRIPTLKILEYLGWERYFRVVGTLDTSFPPHADKAAMIHSLLNELSISAAASLYLGDKLEDGKAADANKMPFIAAGWGYGEWNVGTISADWNLVDSPAEFMKKSQIILNRMASKI